ncbi:hypothetical protein GDO86_005225 [Hymenochirus boettgeri]|uniref:receptor protein-tyrosine kinase n=1 Tax=Hymenochirus boettgeri TaxID=247094 RepID=A0A8T2J119_9PIPI|nr:hypothetical protein GDO86_005225 [Hymenochirus boettgeri]
MHPALLALLITTNIRYGLGTPVIEPSDNVVVDAGSSIKLSCSGNQTVKWSSKIKKYWGLKQMGTSSVLEINQTSYRDTGTFTCSYNDTTLTDSASVHVFVKEGGKYWLNQGYRILAKENSDVLIPCLITDPSIPLSHISLTSPSLNKANVSFDYQKGFTIHAAQMQNEGKYTCQATVNGKVFKASEISLFVNPETRNSLSFSEPIEQIRIQGESFSLTCIASSPQDPSISWEHPATNFSVVSDQKFSSEDKIENWTDISTLIVHHVNMADAGNYTCTGFNSKDRSKQRQVSTSLHVIEKGYVRLNVSQDGRVELKTGESAQLMVQIEAYPSQLSWVWLHEHHGNISNVSSHGTVQSNGHYRNLSILTLNRIQENEEGSYTFFVNNSRANASYTFTVILKRPPQVEIIRLFNSTFICSASGYPLPTIEWFQCPHDSCKISKEPMAEDHSQTKKTKVESLLRVTQENITVRCEASNTVGEDHQEIVISVISTSLACILLVAIFFLYYKYRQKPKFEVRWQIIQPCEGNNYICIDPTQLPYNDKWEFPRINLQFGKTLGAGAFGKVMEATALGLGKDESALRVAVKMLKPSANTDEVEALMSELKILSHLGNHENIVNLLGACTHGGPILVITEYCHHGDLMNFLRKKAEAINNIFIASLEEQQNGDYKNMSMEQKYLQSNSKTTDSYIEMRPAPSHTKSNQGDSLIDGEDTDDNLPLDLYDLLNFSFQVAQGMSFLSSKNCIHRDVAARNVLVSYGRVAKICDFGLARDIENDSNYVVKGNARLPVKWMAPESIFDCVYTVQSDVWSYGILLWEIFSLGRSPYPGIVVNRKFYKMVKEGYKMDCPDYAPLEIYRIMKTCWDLEPTQRPTFNQISGLINKQMNLLYNQDYANISQDQQQDQNCAEDKNNVYSVSKGNNYQFC